MGGIGHTLAAVINVKFDFKTIFNDKVMDAFADRPSAVMFTKTQTYVVSALPS
tara:strand:+ start:2630 stop:2788 length:159 start_codon:yes stop_codon:yes gene_type:complete